MASKNNVVKSYSPAEIARARHLNLVIKDGKNNTAEIEKRDRVLHIIWLVFVYQKPILILIMNLY